MATYIDIQTYVIKKYGWIPQTCWIADVKEKFGIKVRPAPNRKGPMRENPCPPEKRPAIEEAMRRLGMIK